MLLTPVQSGVWSVGGGEEVNDMQCPNSRQVNLHRVIGYIVGNMCYESKYVQFRSRQRLDLIGFTKAKVSVLYGSIRASS